MTGSSIEPELIMLQPGNAIRGSTITISGNTVMMATASTSKKKNGSAALATVLESLPLMVCNTNRLKPTGGETSAISTTSTRKIPNQTRSKPACFTIGMTIAVVSTIIEMPSSAVPSTMYITVSAAISAYELSCRLFTQLASASGMPV